MHALEKWRQICARVVAAQNQVTCILGDIDRIEEGATVTMSANPLLFADTTIDRSVVEMGRGSEKTINTVSDFGSDAGEQTIRRLLASVANLLADCTDMINRDMIADPAAVETTAFDRVSPEEAENLSGGGDNGDSPSHHCFGGDLKNDESPCFGGSYADDVGSDCHNTDEDDKNETGAVDVTTESGPGSSTPSGIGAAATTAKHELFEAAKLEANLEANMEDEIKVECDYVDGGGIFQFFPNEEEIEFSGLVDLKTENHVHNHEPLIIGNESSDFRSTTEKARPPKTASTKIGGDKNDSGKKSDDTTDLKSMNLNTLKCSMCNVSFKTEDGLTKHQSSVELAENCCKVCGKRFCAKKNLKRHLVIHSDEKPFSCELCGLTFKSKRYIAKHKYNMHQENTPASCETCGKTFKNSGYLKTHMLGHTDTTYSCEVCGKVFRWLVGLYKHRKYSHSNQGNAFQCEVCKRTFKEKQTLKNHERIHNKAEHFRCHICSRTFSRQFARDRHCLRVHSSVLVKKVT